MFLRFIYFFFLFFFFLMIRRPTRSTPLYSSAASDVYKRQVGWYEKWSGAKNCRRADAVSYTHLRAHETKANLVCRLLLEKKKTQNKKYTLIRTNHDAVHEKKKAEQKK